MIRTLGLTMLLATAVGAAAAATDLIPFRIKDQRDRLQTDARYRGAPLLVLWADRKGADVMDAWAPLLADSLAGPIAGYRLRLLEVAHGKGAPFFVKGKIKGKFAAAGRGPVLMDWGGEFAAAYGPVEDRCNVWLFDDEGRLVGAWNGAVGDSLLPAGLVSTVRGLAR